MQQPNMIDIHTPRLGQRKRSPVEDFRRLQQNHSRWSGLVAPDTTLLVAIALLMVLGAVMVTSASIPKAGNNGGWIYTYGFRQLIYMLIGVGGAAIAYKVPTRWWFDNSYRILLLGIFMLLVIQIPGVAPTINGAKRWVPLGPVNIQTSEFVRICVIIYAGAFLQRYQNQIHKSLFAMSRLVAVLVVVGVLLLMQPDFGSTVVVCAIVLGMMFLAGVCLIRFFACAVVVVVTGGVLLFAESYRIKRLLGYWDPWADMYGSGYQLANSLIAIGRGETTGVGIGESLEKHHYLPEAHTDFIFSIFAEEMGLVGVCFLMILFGIIVWRAFVIANNADKVRLRFASCVAYGIGLWIGLQALINMSVASGLLPTKGLTLPMVSYGGSSVVASLILLAILLRIDSESRYLLQHEQRNTRDSLHAV